MTMRAWASDQNTLNVEAFIAEPPMERFDERVAPRLAGRNKQHPRTRARPLPQRVSDHLGSVVQPQHTRGEATVGDDVVEFGCQAARR
jgi:hypothetical protein